MAQLAAQGGSDRHNAPSRPLQNTGHRVVTVDEESLHMNTGYQVLGNRYNDT